MNAEIKYELVAVIKHIGKEMDSGHYIAEINIENDWIRFNDALVSKIKVTDVLKLSSEAYMLFYKKLNEKIG